MAFPDYDQILREIWGWEDEDLGYLPILTLASNILTGTNPPYSASDFFQWFPNFAGTPVQVQGTLDGTTGTVTGVSDLTNLAVGQLVAGNGIQCGSVIQSITQPSTLVLSLPTTASGLQTLSIYVSALIPTCVLNAYIYLATSSILQVRYQEMWSFCMALYIAHYLTLWLNSGNLGAGSTPGQIASSGLAMGVAISKHVGDVSIASQPLKMPDWAGTYALTTYGQQLLTFGMAVGSGPVWCY
jgi:Protein of unknown function (DUF4054)